jgi:hypothetical protein
MPRREEYAEELAQDRGFREVAIELDSEIRSEAELATQQAAALSRRRRTLRDVSLQLMARGDTIRLELNNQAFVGRLVCVGKDFVSIRSNRGLLSHVSLRNTILITVMEYATSGGMSAREETNLKAKLVELESSHQSLRVGLDGGGEVCGRVRIVGLDHIVLEHDTQETYVSLHAVGVVTESLPD